MARFALPICLCLAACGDEPAKTPPTEPKKAVARAPHAAPPSGQPASVKSAAAGDAESALRLYYDRIEARRFGEAWALRSGDSAGRERFVADLDRYELYRATIGAASEPVAEGGFLYVEVPVMIVGRLKDETPVATGGSVTMRRPADERSEWRLFTGRD